MQSYEKARTEQNEKQSFLFFMSSERPSCPAHADQRMFLRAHVAQNAPISLMHNGPRADVKLMRSRFVVMVLKRSNRL